METEQAGGRAQDEVLDRLLDLARRLVPSLQVSGEDEMDELRELLRTAWECGAEAGARDEAALAEELLVPAYHEALSRAERAEAALAAAGKGRRSRAAVRPGQRRGTVLCDARPLEASGPAATLDTGQLPGMTTGIDAPSLPEMTAVAETLADLWATGTYGTHPIAHARASLTARGVIRAADLASPAKAAADSVIMVAGLVTHRQRPPTARGVVFLSLEDETGIANVICPPAVWDRCRAAAGQAPALVVSGRVERISGAVSLVAVALRPLRVAATVRSRDFR